MSKFWDDLRVKHEKNVALDAQIGVDTPENKPRKDSEKSNIRRFPLVVRAPSGAAPTFLDRSARGFRGLKLQDLRSLLTTNYVFSPVAESVSLRGSFSAVPTPIFASRYSLESS